MSPEALSYRTNEQFGQRGAMITDEREETLREVCALGNLKAVQHFVNSGVNLNAQNKMNGWSALHWASHRGHDKVVRLLLANGANPNLRTNKGQTALDLAGEKHAAIAEMLAPVTTDEHLAGPEPELPIVPTYMKEPDLEKSWLLPDEFSETKIETLIRHHEAAATTTTTTTTPPAAQAAATASAPEDREILVYLGSRSDENILGSVYLKNESIEASVSAIKAELDGLPENFSLARNNGKVTIPINSKQMNKRLLDIFRGEDDVLVIVPN